MTDEEVGRAVRELLASEGVLATLTLRRGYDDGAGAYVASLHVYQEHVIPERPEVGNVCDGRHVRVTGGSLDEVLRAIPAEGCPVHGKDGPGQGVVRS